MRRKPPLRLVGTGDAAIFDDLEKLQDEQSRLTVPRKRLTETFARIPHDKALGLWRHRLNGTAWVVLIELDRLILKARGRNPVKFSQSAAAQVWANNSVRAHAFRRLRSGRGGPCPSTWLRCRPLGDASVVGIAGLKPSTQIGQPDRASQWTVPSAQIGQPVSFLFLYDLFVSRLIIYGQGL